MFEIIFVEYFFDLFYNFCMKKLCIFCTVFILLIQASFAVELTNLLQKKSEDVKPQNSPIGQQANILYAENDIKKAFELLVSIPARERTAQNWLLMGNILQDLGKTEDAFFMYNQAAAADENNFKAFYNLGNMYLDEEKPSLAIEEYKKVLKLKPEYPYAYYNMGCAYIKSGELKKARNAFLNAVALKNTDADFHYNLAYVYKKLGDEKRAKLYLDYYNKIINAY